MPEPERALVFIRPLNRANVRYIVTGSIAATIYGEPRFTHDVDFVVFLNENNIRELQQIFPAPDFYVPPLETIFQEVAREQKGHFNIVQVETGLKADFYPTGGNEFNAWAFRRKQQVQFYGEIVTLAPPEYVIVRKLEYYRDGGSEKHLRDIRSMFTVSREQIDKSELNEWIQRQGVHEQWQKATAGISL